MDLKVVQSVMKNCELFEGVDQSQLGFLMLKGSAREFSEGETVYRKGEKAGGTLALIVSGKVNVIAEDGYVLRELGVGEVMGEVGTISQQGTRTVSVTASQPTQILQWHIRDIKEGSPELIKRLKDLAWKRIKNWYE